MDKKIQSTIEYYNRCAEDFCHSTASVNFQALQEKFLGYLPDRASILDFGCGSGRDTKYFLSKGYTVSATDGSADLCKRASAYTGILVRHELFQDLYDVDRTMVFGLVLRFCMYPKQSCLKYLYEWHVL